MQCPKRGGKNRANVIRQALVVEGGKKDGHTLLAIFACAVAESGKRVVRFAGVAKQRAEEFAVALEDVELRMKGGAEPALEVQVTSGKSVSHAASVFGLNIIVVGLNDGFLAGEVVVGGAERSSRCGCEFAHGGGFQTALAKDTKCGGEKVGTSELCFGRGNGFIEHVQILETKRAIVKNNSEHVQVYPLSTV